MKKIEKFVLWASILSFVVYLVSGLGLLAYGDWNAKLASFSVRTLVYYIPHIVFGIWLWWAAKQQSLDKFTWGFFGFALGIYGVAVFYILLIYFNVLSMKNALKNET